DCADSAGSVPYIARACEDAGDIALRVLRRSEHPEVMDLLATGGRRATPAVVIFGPEWQWLGRWGPRPQDAAALFDRLHGSTSKPEMDERLDAWYAEDDGSAVLREFLPLLRPARGTRASLPVYDLDDA